jgi:hypothetical protein
MRPAASVARLETLEFTLERHGSLVHCLVTISALKARFGATDETAPRVMLDHLPALRSAALDIASRCPPGERIIVRGRDIA